MGLRCACKQIFTNITFCLLNGFIVCWCVCDLVCMSSQGLSCGREYKLNVQTWVEMFFFLYIINGFFFLVNLIASGWGLQKGLPLS